MYLLKTISLNRTLDTNFVLCDCFTCLQNDVEIPIPHYFVCERAKALKEREKLLGQILAKLGPQDTGQVSCICDSILVHCLRSQCSDEGLLSALRVTYI